MGRLLRRNSPEGEDLRPISCTMQKRVICPKKILRQSTLVLVGFLLLAPSLVVDTADAFVPISRARVRPHAATNYLASASKQQKQLGFCRSYLALEVGGDGDSGTGGAGSNSGGSGGGNGRGRRRRDNDNSNDDDEENGNVPGDNSNDRSLLSRLRRWAQSAEGREDIFTYGISVVLAILVRTFAVEPRYIPSLSMYPTFDIGDQLFVEKISSKWFGRQVQRGDVVVFSPPQSLLDILTKEYGDSSEIKPKEALIKRVVATEGDRAQVKRDGKLYVNGELQQESFTKEDRANYKLAITVPKDNVLVLGDNRNESLDGHIWGCLPTDNIIGRAICVYWPPWRVGRKDK